MEYLNGFSVGLIVMAGFFVPTVQARVNRAVPIEDVDSRAADRDEAIEGVASPPIEAVKFPNDCASVRSAHVLAITRSITMCLLQNPAFQYLYGSTPVQSNTASAISVAVQRGVENLGHPADSPSSPNNGPYEYANTFASAIARLLPASTAN